MLEILPDCYLNMLELLPWFWGVLVRIVMFHGKNWGRIWVLNCYFLVMFGVGGGVCGGVQLSLLLLT